MYKMKKELEQIENKLVLTNKKKDRLDKQHEKNVKTNNKLSVDIVKTDTEIKAMKEKVDKLENGVAEKNEALKKIEGKYDRLDTEIKE